MKKVRVLPALNSRGKKRSAGHSNKPIVFCEKTTGAAQFYSPSPAKIGSSAFTLERMASLLAIQCLARGNEPGDFEILVPAEKEFSSRLIARAQELLNAGRAAAAPASLSLRQREILQSVVCHRANKEIAAKLNITVRTVKFHISALLCKFGVDNRAELGRRAAAFLGASVLRPEGLEFEEPLPIFSAPPSSPTSIHSALHTVNKPGRSVRFPGRVLTA